ncbi:SDR family oxidoreductase [Rufibacter sp. XAAS-G3-1]|uniref:SDR family oxidoreductase n=1 Tax=Rufibacter sp. XAAS-G3-1 TaxID=2729134 RepID=UPI0015E7CC06|nr:SDR family oxidoreductase [Rufibacter sp. XAAS-G3-1]
METVLVLGSTGSLGSSVLEVLRQQSYRIRATARTPLKAEQLTPWVDEVMVCDPTEPGTLTPALLEGVDYIISALGKSLSLSDDSRASFHEVNYQGNLNVLKLAQAYGQVKKFVYVAAFSGENHPNVAYFKAHEDFTKALRKSGIPNSIIKPPVLFSAFLNLLPLARKGRLASFGPGDAITNPIHEHEVAEACVQALTLPVSTIELGGPVAYSRLQLAELVGKAVGKNKPVPRVPYWLVRTFLPMVRLLNQSLYEKAAFFVEVAQTDCVAPAKGHLRLEDYLAEHV